MGEFLNLLPSGVSKVEKRVFPRYPLNYLTFRIKSELGDLHKTYEVIDISLNGMQIEQKHDELALNKGQGIHGVISWYGSKCEVSGKVRWVKKNRFGIAFDESKLLQNKIKEFLNVNNFIKNLKPLHERKYALERPADLKYWLRADGPLELFVWSHKNGKGIARFQVVLFRDFVEWEDQKGMKTGGTLSRRDLETPLFTEDEFAFSSDESISYKKIESALDFMEKIPGDYIDPEDLSFIKRQLSV